MTATGIVREGINAEVSREALRDWEWANAYNHFSEYRKLMNPRFKLKGHPLWEATFRPIDAGFYSGRA